MYAASQVGFLPQKENELFAPGYTSGTAPSSKNIWIKSIFDQFSMMILLTDSVSSVALSSVRTIDEYEYIEMPSARDSPTGDPLGSLRHRESRRITTRVGTFNDAGVRRAPRELNH
ncbi:hypothetical protein EVAR_78617_1 [Eumeta japonica]|uniref:Uncharacterized protein n=1 Tax=Eumeta variegata TaxID=151549 RepID=A0A4C1U7X4_EUMVA|nr:hypothetical protein EVAR_78617_1 [Eumeta japonica]